MNIYNNQNLIAFSEKLIPFHNQIRSFIETSDKLLTRSSTIKNIEAFLKDKRELIVHKYSQETIVPLTVKTFRININEISSDGLGTAPQDDSGTAPQDDSETVLLDVLETVPQDVLETVPQDVLKTVPQDVLKTVPQDVLKTVPQDVLETAPQDVLETAPQDVLETKILDNLRNYKEIYERDSEGNFIFRTYPTVIYLDSTVQLLESLADRISAIESSHTNKKALALINNLRNYIKFNKSINQWLQERPLPEKKRNKFYERIKQAWIKKSKEVSLARMYFKVPSCIGHLSQLKNLDLSHNKLKEFPKEIIQLKKLEIIDLCHNKLKKLPSSIGELSNLKSIRLYNNKFSVIPNEVVQLKKLKTLNFDNNKLKKLIDLTKLIELKYLTLHNNQLAAVPDEIGNLKNLKLLTLDNNQIEQLPSSIGKLEKLQELLLYRNMLTSLPEEIRYLKELKILNVKKNKLTSVTSAIGELKKLKILKLSDNEIKTLPDAIGKLKKIRKINLNYNEIEILPKTIEKLTSLRRLFLRQNNLDKFPDEIRKLTNLEKLRLDTNILKILPGIIGVLRELRFLGLSDTNLESLPETIGELVHLETLMVSDNYLKSLPATFNNLISLEHLDISNNGELKELPDSLRELPALVGLDIEDTEIPEEQAKDILEACKKLKKGKGLFIYLKQLALFNDKKEIDLTGLPSQLSEDQQNTLFDWLKRLKITKEFKKYQKELAATICDMLSTVMINPDFSTFFFLQAEANNRACEDRAAMSFNEIHTFWKICTLSQNAQLEDKFRIIVSAAKTLRLRKELSLLIHQNMHAHNNKEAVQIYLYYETLLREELGLLSPIKTMKYKQLGKREWINIKTLKKNVKSNYKEELNNCPAFLAIAEQEDSFNELWDPKFFIYDKEMGKLEENTQNLKDEEFKQQYDKLMEERNRAYSEVALQWFEETYVTEVDEPPRKKRRK